MGAIHLVRPRTNRLLRRHDRAAVLSQHQRLFEAIRERDTDAAERAFLDHATYIARERQAAIQEQRRAASEIAIGELAELSDDEALH